MADRPVRIITKQTAVPGRIPTGTTGYETNFIRQGEMAQNTADRKLFGFDGTNVFEYGSDSFLGLTGGTIAGDLRINNNLSASTIFSGLTDLSDIFIGVNDDYVQNLITVGTGGYVDFTSVKDAVDSITGASAVNRYVIQIGPGIYIEDTIKMKPFVILNGFSPKACVIEVNSPSKDVIVGREDCSISNLTLRGASNPGYAAISYSGDGGSYFRITNCRFDTSDIILKQGCWGGISIVKMFNCDIERACNFSTGFSISGNGFTELVLDVSGLYWSVESNIYFNNLFKVEGSLVDVKLTDVVAINNGAQLPGSFLHLKNGSEVVAMGCHVAGLEKGFYTENIGAAPELLVDGVVFEDATLNLDIQHTGTTGYFDGYTNPANTFINTACTFFINSGETNTDDITRVQSGLNTYTGGTDNFPTINISAATLNYLSATTVSGETLYSGGTNLYSIFQTIDSGDITRVQPGSNITTGGTGNLPIVSVVSSPSFNSIIASGASSFQTLSATTLISGSTNLYNIFARPELVVNNVNPGSNITTGGTEISPIISVSSSPAFNNITFSGTATGNALSATTISGGTIYSGSTDLYSIFQTPQSDFVANIVTVGLSGNVDFNSIKEAVDSISGSSDINRYEVKVGPGVYIEDEIDLTSKPFVSVVGSSIQTTVVKPVTTTQNIFSIGEYNEISFVWLEGAGSGYAGISMADSGNYGQAHKVTFNNCDIGIIVSSSTQDTYFYGEYIDYNGEYSYGTKIISENGFVAFVNMENYYNFPTGTASTIGTYIDGSAAQADILASGNIGVGLGNALVAVSGATINMSAVAIEDWEKGIYVPETNSFISLISNGVTFQNCNQNLIVENSGTTGYYVGYVDINKRFISDASSFFITNQDSHIITVAKKGGDFNSIYSAITYITSSSTDNRYVISVGPGTYVEPELDLTSKPYVSIIGDSLSSVIVQPDSSMHHVFNLGVFNDLRNITIQSAGTGYAAVNMENQGTYIPSGQILTLESYSRVHRVSIENCDIGINIFCDSPVIDTMFYGEFNTIIGDYSYGIKIVNNSGICACGMFVHLTMNPNTGTTPIGVYVSGTEANFETHACMINGNGLDTGFSFENGSSSNISATLCDNVGTVVSIPNIGDAPEVDIIGVTSTNSILDLNIQHPTARVTFNGTIDYDKVVNNSSRFSFNYLDISTGAIEISKKLNITFENGTHTDLSTLLVEGATMGVVEGGNLSAGTGFTVVIGNGFGYFEQFPDNDIIQRVDWPATGITLSANSDEYIYFNSNAILTNSSSFPDTKYNVLLGRVVTNSTGIELIDASPSNAEHTSNLLSNFAKRALGPIYSSGSIVTEGLSAFTVNVSNGVYYFGENVFEPSGSSGLTFTSVYRDGIGGFINSSTTIVDNSYRDDGSGILTAITSGYYVKHSFYVVGQGVNEKYYLVYAQDEWSTLLSAQEANIPSIPSYFKDSVTLIAGLIVQQGASGITQIRDLRPVVGFKSEGVNASADHLSLLNLNAGDAGHHQFLMLDGSKNMNGTLNMGSNPIISASSVNSVIVEAHASRHNFNGPDPLLSAVPISIGNSNLEGTDNIHVSRADHQHAHGALSGGSTHAVVTSTINGYMSATDKVYFDTISGQFNTKANLSGATFTATVTAPVLSSTTFSAGTINSGSTNLYNIFSTTDTVTRVQPGSNITTGGTGNNPVVNVVASPSFDSITASGASSFTTLSATSIVSGSTDLNTYFNAINSQLTTKANLSGATFTDAVVASSLSATTISGGTLLSGSTNIYTIFAKPEFVVNNVNAGSNIITGGTAVNPIISVSASPSFNNITFSGVTTGNELSANTISGGTLISGSTNLDNIFLHQAGYLFQKAGTVSGSTFTGAPRKATVTFTTNFPSANYAITVTGDVNRTWTVESITSSGFTINSNANGQFNANNVYWIAMQIGEGVK